MAWAIADIALSVVLGTGATICGWYTVQHYLTQKELKEQKKEEN